MTDHLSEQTERGVTLIPALGFDMNHPSVPEDRGPCDSRKAAFPASDPNQREE
jgi:hypothetical protein